METFSVLLAICAENTSITGEFLSQRPVTQSFDVFFHLCLNKWLSKQSWGWWFETPSRSLWRHCNDYFLFLIVFDRLTCIYTYGEQSCYRAVTDRMMVASFMQYPHQMHKNYDLKYYNASCSSNADKYLTRVEYRCNETKLYDTLFTKDRLPFRLHSHTSSR